jgi:light-regulated signal transduction histidine kinase (bacteriophytochrome)
MKTAMSRPEETERLQDLGRASMQIVHDLKNQLNGLKLYATFLRRRIEKSERPGDEQETVGKLISGLDRAADDLSTIVRYGQPVELKKQPGFEIDKVLRSLCSTVDDTNSKLVWKPDSDVVQGSFDHFKLTDALKWLCMGALKHRETDNDGAGEITVTTKLAANDSGQAVIEWAGLRHLDRDPFRSFAGSDEVKLALAAKYIEAHGGSAKFIDKKFVVELPLNS